MWLLKGSREDDAPGAEERSQRSESTAEHSRTVALRQVARELGPPFRRRQPGGVVEASGVLGDERRQHEPSLLGRR